MLSKLLNLISPKRRAEFTGHYDRAERTRTYDVDSKPRRPYDIEPKPLSSTLPKTESIVHVSQIPPPHCREPEHPAPCNRRACITCSHSEFNEYQHLFCRHYWSLVEPGDTCPDWSRDLCDGCSGPRFPEPGTIHPEPSYTPRDVVNWDGSWMKVNQ